MTQPSAGTAPVNDFPPGFGDDPDKLPKDDEVNPFEADAEEVEEEDDDSDVEDPAKLPQWAQDKLKALEKDNFKYRTKLRTATKTPTPAKDDATKDTVAPDATALEEVRAQARAEAKMEFSEQLAGERLVAGLMQLGIENAEEVVGDLNMARFVTDAGDVNAEAVKDALQRYKSLTPKRRRTVGAGQSGGAGSAGSNADQFAQALGLLPS